jgi:hypothetical protein
MKINFKLNKNIVNIKAVIAIYIFISLLSTPIYIVYAQVMTSTTYKLQSDSVNFGGARSNSTSYKTEDTVGEVSTGNITGTSYNASIGYQQADISTSGGSNNGGGNSGGNNGGSGISGGSGYEVINVSDFVAIPNKKDILLKWTNPENSNIVSVKIIRSDKFYPINMNDGETIYEGSENTVIDHDVVQGVKYYYALFTKNTTGQYSTGVLASAIIKRVGDNVYTPVITKPFEDIKMAPNISSQFKDLTLADFDFIQDGKIINHSENIVPIDGKKNLTVRLKYTKVPEILKTIAITLANPSDQSEVFTFLLRVNKTKTYYEASIAPLKRSGDYKLNLVILDFRNQGLKKLEGNLKAVAFESLLPIISAGNKNKGLFYWIILVLILLIIVTYTVVSSIKRKEKKYGTI